MIIVAGEAASEGLYPFWASRCVGGMKLRGRVKKPQGRLSIDPIKQWMGSRRMLAM